MLDSESWVARETKRIETDKAIVDTMLKSIAQGQITVDAETEAIAKLRSRISADGDPRWEDLDAAMEEDAAAELSALALR